MASWQDRSSDFYDRGPHASFGNEARKPVATPVTFMAMRLAPGDYADPEPAPDALLQLGRSGGAARWDFGTGRRRGALQPGAIVFSPAGVANDYTLDRELDLLVAALPRADLVSLLGSVRPNFTGDFGPLHGPFFADTFIASLVEQMWAESATDTPRGRIFLDSALLALLTNPLAKAEEGALPELAPALRRGGLAPFRLRRVEELAMAHLADDLSLEALAEVAGLSPFHFSRAFRAETGTSPHAWLLERRLERAKELLMGTSMTVNEVAKAVGFAGKQGLIGAFKRAVGTTPIAWQNGG